jgi:membrane protease YdiL (CAAX protease family)
MALIGPDFRAARHGALYRPSNPAGLGQALGIFVVLLIVNQLVLQLVFSIGMVALTTGLDNLLASGLADLQHEFLRATLLSLLPSGLLTAVLAWILAGHGGFDPGRVLALRVPALGVLGWGIIVGGFVLALFALFGVLAWLFGLDLTSSGLVEQAVMQLSGDPLYFLVAGGLIVGAPLAEELTFRGQIFSALSTTRLGTLGASILTSALWAGVHITQPLPVIPLLFLMGLVLSWILVRFGSLWLTVACHAAWNSVSAVTLYLASQQ